MDIRTMKPHLSHPATLALLLPLALAACAPTEPTATPEQVAPATTEATAEATTPSASMLAGHHWQLSAATDASGQRIDALFPTGAQPGGDRPLTLDFKDGRLSVSGGCNRLGGGYQLDPQGQLQVDDLTSTMMACDAALMQADEAISALLATPLQAQVEASAPPRLVLQSATGGSSTWVGQASAETRFGGPGETVFLEVAPQRVACNHPLIPDYQCLRVREIRYDANSVKQAPGEWQPLYEDIEGFEFVAGERKLLRLKKFKREPAPADASSIAYVLDMVVESEIMPADGSQ